MIGGIGLASAVMVGAVAADGLGGLRPSDPLADATASLGAGRWPAGDAMADAPVHRRWSSTNDGSADGVTGADAVGEQLDLTDDGAAEPETTAVGDGADASTAPVATGDAAATPQSVPAPTVPVAPTISVAPTLAPSGWTSPPVPSAGGTPTAATAGAPGPVCEVQPLAPTVGLDAFYTQVCWAEGIPVVSSPEVEPRALQAAADIVVNMLRPRPDLRALLVEGRLRVGIIGEQQRAVDLPEYRDLPTSFPDTNWDAARAYGATPRRPLLAVPEENLLCSPRDTYPGQSVLVHELGHTVLDMAVVLRDAAFESRVQAAYKAARSNPVYADTYALVNADEYWAEGVQDFFDASRAAYGPNGGGDGYDGPIASRDALRSNDPVLYGLVASVFTENPWRPACPS